jgi:ribonucleoside-diphosphate reductase alpha chain
VDGLPAEGSYRVSIALQHGVPLESLVRKFAYMRFEPRGATDRPEIRQAHSIPDYVARWLASRFLDVDAQDELGVLTPEVKRRRAARLDGHVAGPLRGLSDPDRNAPTAAPTSSSAPRRA